MAGLAAIGHAKAMGAVVRAFDTRPAVKEQVESMGGEFLTVTIHVSMRFCINQPKTYFFKIILY